MKKKLVIDLDELLSIDEGNAALIICKKTGVHYTMQIGGMQCNHIEIEGFVLKAPTEYASFDTCQYGCYELPELEDQKKLLIKDFNKWAIHFCSDKLYSINFDYSRIDMLQESLIPVIIDGVYDSFYKLEFRNQKAFIHNENCD